MTDKTDSDSKNEAGKEVSADSPRVPGSNSKGARSSLRKHLDERLRILHERAMIIEDELRRLDGDRFYRVCIFGSARIKPNTPEYENVFGLARMLAWENIDILTGGGPGLMEAANKGAKLGQSEKNTKSFSFGLSIELEWEPLPNRHLDVKRHHHRFSSRLDDFMRLSHAIVVTPGGVGTLLELFFTWQLLQVKHIERRPFIFMNKDFWSGLLDWMREQPLKHQLINEADFDHVTLVDTPEEAYKVLSEHHKLRRHSRV